MRTPSTAQAACGNCKAPMEALEVEGHYKRLVAVDACFNCHHLWFDDMESVRLSGLGWVQLLRQMIASPRAIGTVRADLGCVRCGTSVKTVRNLTRFGRFAALECPNKHGQYQSFSLLLAERGLVRPIAAQDRAVLREEGRDLECLNCGAIQPNVAGGQALPHCTHCDSPLVMIDLPRLTQALLVRHGDEVRVDQAAEALALDCTGCGAPIDPTHDTRCAQCDHPVALPSLRHVADLLDRVEPILRGQAPRQAKPWGEKLRAARGDHRQTAIYRWVAMAWRDVALPGAGMRRAVALALVVGLGWLLARCS